MTKRRAVGRVDRFRDKWRARLRGKHVGLFDTDTEAEEALVALQAREEHKEPDTCRAIAKTWFAEREKSGIVEIIKTQESDWHSRVEIKEAKWLDMPPRSVRTVHLQKWLKALAKRNAFEVINRKVNGETVPELRDSGRRLSHESVTKAVSLVKLFFDWAKSEGMIEIENPARKLLMPVHKRPPRKGTQRVVHLLAHEIVALFALALPVDVRAVLALAIYAGLRRSEIWGLRWEFVDFEARKLLVRLSYAGDCKSRTSVRDVSMLPYAYECLHAYYLSLPARPINGLVFPADGGGCHSRDFDCGWRDKKEHRTWTDAQGVKHPVKAQKWQRDCDEPEGLRITPGWRSKASIRPEVTFLCLRHTNGCHLVQGTLLGNAERFELHELCLWLGHSSLKVTERHYAEFCPKNLHAKALGNPRAKALGTGALVVQVRGTEK